MKSTMKLSALSSALALAGVMAFSGPAVADQISADYVGMTETKRVDYSVVLPPVGSPSTTKTGRTTTGIFNFENATGPIVTFGTDQFVSFCIDLDDTVTANNTWNVVSLAEAPDTAAGPMGSTKANAVAKMLGGAITSGVLNEARNLTALQKQAMQLAIWEVVHEGPGTAYNIETGNMRFTSGLTSDLINQANDFFAYIGDTSVTAMSGLVGLTSDNQDFVGQVPLPAAAWLFGSALVGVAAVARRKKKDQEDNLNEGLISA
jgi:hypothetical protein